MSSIRSLQLFQSFPKDWMDVMEYRLHVHRMEALSAFVCKEYDTATVFPPKHSLFRAFQETPFSHVRVLILGQDPYHEPGEACGLSFSVPNGVQAPPSLKNIFKEYASDLNLPIPTTTDLSPWAQQGVLLLNTVLSVRAGAAASHAKHGWEEFTDAAISSLSASDHPIVFLLWGGFAQKKKSLIDSARHIILESAHPSPLSAYRGFFGSKPFTHINAALHSAGMGAIDWML